MVTFVLTVVSCICSFVSMIALISISCSVRRLRDKFKASPQMMMWMIILKLFLMILMKKNPNKFRIFFNILLTKGCYYAIL